MARKFKINLIHGRRCYSFQEIADLLHVHVRTVQAWKKAGLVILEGSKHPFLVEGNVLKHFLKAKFRKVPLSEGQAYCLKCRKGVTPINLEILKYGKRIGKDKIFVVYKGNCPVCGCKVNRFACELMQKEGLNLSANKADH